jgi:hypothetical protein
LFFDVLSLGGSGALGNGLCEKAHELAIAGEDLVSCCLGETVPWEGRGWLPAGGTNLLRVKREYALSSFSETISTAGWLSLRMIYLGRFHVSQKGRLDSTIR